MNRFRSLFAILVVVIVFGCASNKQEENAAVTATITDTDVAEAPTVLTDTSAKSFEDIGVQLLESESIGNLKMGANASKLKELFGEPSKKSKPEMSQVDGAMHQTWDFKTQGISVDLSGEKELTTNSITVTSPCTFKTTKQIGIGDTQEAVMKAYADAIDKNSGDDTTIVAGSIYGGIIFTLENKKVKSIFIGASAD